MTVLETKIDSRGGGGGGLAYNLSRRACSPLDLSQA